MKSKAHVFGRWVILVVELIYILFSFWEIFMVEIIVPETELYSKNLRRKVPYF